MAASEFIDIKIAPPGLEKALSGGNVLASLVEYCHSLSDRDLELAYRSIHGHHTIWKQAVREIIQDRESAKALKQMQITNRLAIAAIVISIIAIIVSVFK